MDDFRAITIQNNIFPHVNGSSRIKIDSDVDIICSVKVQSVSLYKTNVAFAFSK